MTHAAALLAFCAAAGIAREQVLEGESPDGYLLSLDLPAARLKPIKADDVQALVDAFGCALTLTIGLPDVLPMVEVREGKAPSLKARLQDVQTVDDALDLRLEIAVDKQALLVQLGARGEGHHALFYLYHDNLLAFIRQPPHRIDDTLFAAPDRPTLVVVSDTAVRVHGPLLAVVDPAGIDAARAHLGEGVDALRPLLSAMRGAAANRLHWSGFCLPQITPLHFLCEQQGGDAGGLAAILDEQRRRLFVLYTANRASYEDTGYCAAYAGSEDVAEMALAACTGDRLSLPSLEALRWPFEGRETDRLTLLQNVLAREVEGQTPAARYCDLYRRLDPLLKRVYWHHRVLLDGQIDRHFDLVEAATQDAADAAGAVAAQVEAVTKGVTDTFLGAVGVVVVTLLASLVKDESQGRILQLGMWVYAGYLFFIQGAYRLGSIWHSYRLLASETDKRLDVYRAKLGDDRIEGLSAPLTRRKRQFQRWFWFTAGLLLVMSIALVFLGSIAPTWLATTIGPAPGASPLGIP